MALPTFQELLAKQTANNQMASQWVDMGLAENGQRLWGLPSYGEGTGLTMYGQSPVGPAWNAQEQALMNGYYYPSQAEGMPAFDLNSLPAELQQKVLAGANPNDVALAVLKNPTGEKYGMPPSFIPQSALVYDALGPEMAAQYGITPDRLNSDMSTAQQLLLAQQQKDFHDLNTGMNKWAPAIIAMIAGAGFGGYLPGSESAAGAAAGAAEGASAGAAAGDFAAADMAASSAFNAGNTLGAGGSAAGFGGATGGSMGLFDSIGNFFGGDSYGTNYLSDLAAQDFADFGVEGVNALGNSLGASNGIDWASPFLSEAQISGMINSTPGLMDSVTNYITQNPTSTLRTAMSALTGSGGGGLLGAGLGALLGGMGGSKQAGTIDTTSTPWAGQQPYLLDLFNKAQSQVGASPMTARADTNYQSLLGGPTTNPTMGLDNPYLNTAIQNAQDDVTRNMQTQFNTAQRQSGSFGNSGLQETFARELPKALGNISTNMRMQDYGQQQGLFENAVNRTANATQGAAGYQWNPLQNYSSIVQGKQWGGTTSQPYFTNPMSSALGGATLGYNLFGGK